MVMVFLMLACGSSSSEITPPTAPESDSVAMLTRISMDVRGIRPSVEDVDTVIADASVLDSLVDEYLEDPRFPERIVDLYSDTGWAGCVRTRKSTSGGCLMIGGHLIKSWSKTHPSGQILFREKPRWWASRREPQRLLASGFYPFTSEWSGP